MDERNETKPYHVKYRLIHATDEDLEKWAHDPNCIEMEACAKALAERQKQKAAKTQRLSEQRQELQDNPFDPRTEVSADARHIVLNLWMIFVVLPFLLGLVAYVVWVIK